MEPHNNNFGPPMELPQPQEADGQTTPEAGPAPQPEKRGAQMPSTTAAAPPEPIVLPDPGAMPPAGMPAQQAAQTNSATAALMADDADLIEKEWVVRAKAIVEHTKDDPHLQNREMNKVKADYLKKRYNKDLKVSEG